MDNAAIPLAYWRPLLVLCVMAVVALIWIVPILLLEPHHRRYGKSLFTT